MRFSFDDVEVDVDRNEVRVGGELRPVEPQVFDVLVHLVEQRHRVVHKEELLDAVWGSRYVSGSAVTSRIKTARQVIGDSGREQRLIRTVHGRGYRFVGEVEIADGGAPGPGRAAAGAPVDHLATAPRGSIDTTAPVDTTSPIDTTSGSTDTDWPLVGRDVELARIASMVADVRVGGALLTGPAGVGKSRLARAVIEHLASIGRSVARINGHAEISTVPLGAVAHLLPADVVDITDLPGDLARAALLQRARRAIGELAGADRLILMVDDVERIDRLSSALLASLIESGTIFALMTQRLDDGAAPAFDHLVRSGRIEHLHLELLPTDQLTALLSRVLGGPLEPDTSTALVRAASGSPGLLRQLVDASIGSGALTMRRGMWVISGIVSSPPDLAAAIEGRLAILSDAERDALELIAIAGDLDLDIAFALIDDELLDRLELAGMIAVRQVGPSARIRVSHPMFGEILRERLTPLRKRRHRTQLAEAIAASETAAPADVLRLVQLRVDTDGEIEDELLLRSVVLALVEGDYRLALRLGRRIVAPSMRQRTAHLRGEALYMLGRFEESAQVLRSIDLDELDDVAAADVVRRLATYRFFGVWQPGRAIAELRAARDRFHGDGLALIDSYLAGLIAFDGRDPAAATAIVGPLRHAAGGVARGEAHCAAALVGLIRGRRVDALRELDAFRAVNAGADGVVTDTGARWSCMIEMLVHLQLGDPASGLAAHDRDFGMGNPPNIRFVAMAAGRVALAAADYRQVFDWLDPLIEIAESVGIHTQSVPLLATRGLAALATGQPDRARHDLDVVRRFLPEESTTIRFDLRGAVLQVDGTLGRRDEAIDALLRDADEARAIGNRYCEEQLLAAATHLGGGSRTEPLLRRLTEELDGPLIICRHRAALAALGEVDPAEVMEELAAMGMRHEAMLVGSMPA